MVNTQQVLRAAIVPGLAVLVSALAIAAWRGRGRKRYLLSPLRRPEAAEAGVASVIIVLLLGAVATGRLYAVEAAATGGVLLLGWGFISRRMERRLFSAVLGDAMALTGLLMALLIGATTFSLILRGFATDALVAQGLHALGTQPRLMLGAVLAGMIACSFVLDAFEMIFLVIPLVMPPVLTVIPDAAWVAALTLLVLQMGFLLPPLGYAVVMSRATMPDAPPVAALARALAPHLVAQALIIAALLAWPGLTRLDREATVPVPAGAVSNEDAERLMDEAFRRNSVAPSITPPPASTAR